MTLGKMINPGTIAVAELGGVYVVKMKGDVRLTLCLSFDEYIENILDNPSFSTVVFDLSGAQAIDSTTLGLMAKFSIKSQQHGKETPLVVSNQPGINRILMSMGFDDIFHLVDKSDVDAALLSADEQVSIHEQNGNETAVKKTVLEAHRVLMDMNDDNKQAFQDLVETLESAR